MQALCQWDVQGDASAEALAGVFETEGPSRRAAGYAEKLTRCFFSQNERVDKHLSAASSRWALSRISPVDRNVMRVAVVETLGSERDVHLQTPSGVQVVDRVPSRVTVAEGNDLDVFLDVSRMHVFEPGEAGLNIGLNGYGARSSVN